MRFWVRLLVAVLGIGFVAGVLGLGPVLSAAICIATVLASIVVKKFVIPLAGAILDGHDPFSNHGCD